MRSDNESRETILRGYLRFENEIDRKRYTLALFEIMLSRTQWIYFSLSFSLSYFLSVYLYIFLSLLSLLLFLLFNFFIFLFFFLKEDRIFASSAFSEEDPWDFSFDRIAWSKARRSWRPNVNLNSNHETCFA